MRQIEDIIGQKFGHLTVLEIVGKDKHNNFKYKCRCDCGKSTIKYVNSLRKRKTTISCGCKTSFYRSQNGSLPKFEASFNEILRRYKTHAKEKNREFLLSKKQFKKLTSSNCYYCNSTPKTFSPVHSIRHNGAYIYNGIDRKNNAKGYIKSNSVPCCETCNRMKLEMTSTEFLKHIKRIYDWNKKKI